MVFNVDLLKDPPRVTLINMVVLFSCETVAYSSDLEVCQLWQNIFKNKTEWRSETLDVVNVIIVQSAFVLNMNTEVFRIHDRNILYKIGDLKYNGKYFM